MKALVAIAMESMYREVLPPLNATVSSETPTSMKRKREV